METLQFDFYDLITLTIGISSLILGFFAVYISLYHKKQADAVNEKTIDLLLAVKTDANTISQIAIPELKEYGKSMRKLVFNEKVDIDDLGGKIDKAVSSSIDSINEKISEIKNSIPRNGNSNFEDDIKNIINKLNSLEDFTNESRKGVRENIKNITNDIEIDMSVVNEDVVKVKIGYFNSLQSLLNTLYTELLHLYFPTFSYGKKWVLRNNRNGTIIGKNNRNDTRSLKSVDILPGDSLMLMKL